MSVILNQKRTLNGKTIISVQIYFYRINSGGYAAGQPITLYTHNYTGVPSGMPLLNYGRNFRFYEIPPEEQNPVKTYPKVVKGIYITGLVHLTADTAVIRERATNMANIDGTFEKGHEFLMAGAFTGWYEVVHEEKRRYIKQQDATPTFFPDR